MGWTDPPPVIVVAGAQEFKRIREMRKMRKAAQRTKRRIDTIDGSVSGDLGRALSASVWYGDQKSFLVVEKPLSTSLDPVISHWKSGDNTTCLVLYVDGKVRAKSKLEKAIKAHDLPFVNFPEPKSWELEEQAIRFAIREAKSFKKELEKPLAVALVRTVGTKLGIIHHEVWKLATYLDAIGETRIKATHLKGLISVMDEASAYPMVDALGHRNARKMLQVMWRHERTTTDDPTMRVCGLLAASVGLWLHAHALARSGMDPETASRVMGVSPVRMKRSLLPFATNWGEAGLMDLLRTIVDAERAVKTGKLAPWIYLQARLSSVCAARNAAG